MLRNILFIVLFIVFILPGICLADGKDQIELAAFTMDEVVVTATKTEENRSEVPNAVIIMDDIDLKKSGADTLGDLLGNEQGIDLRTYGNYGGAAEEIHIRGMGAEGTQVLVNGLAVNSPSLGTADTGKITLNNIEKIELVKGAGSLLYGSGAMAGTINIITKGPEKDVTELNVTAGYGSNSTINVSAEQGMFLTDDFGYFITTTKKETDGFRSNSDMDHEDVSLNLVYDGDQGPDISLYWDYMDRSYGLPGVETPPGTEEFIINGIKIYDRDSSNLLNAGGDEDTHIVLDASISPVKQIKLNLKGTYMDMESFNKNVYAYFDWNLSASNLAGSKTWVTNKVKGLEGNMDMDLIDEMNILLGAEYKEYDWENRSMSLDANVEEIPDSENVAAEGLDTYGLFAEIQYRPVENLKVIAGLRKEEHSEFGSEYVPRYGAVISPSEHTAIKVNYGKHFNAPTPNDLFWPYEDWGYGMGTQGNRNLAPETGKHIDAGIIQDFLDNRVFVNVNYFKWDINDKITWVPDASYFYTPRNLDNYNGEGWEAGVSINPLYHTSLSLSYTYSEATEAPYGGVDRQALYTAKQYFKGDINYFNDSGFAISATFRYTGDRPGYYALDTDTEPEIILPSYYTVDLNVEQGFFDHWLLSLRCKNLFDEEYYTFTSSFMDQTTGVSSIERYPGAGRSFFFSVSYEY